MICLATFIIFSVLGIFSLKYRILAREAFRCVFRRVTLRPCDTSFNQKIKAKITAKLLSKKKIKLAHILHKYFELLSWIFTILLFLSLFFSAKKVFNLVKFGTCDPNSASCVFNRNDVNYGGDKCETKW